MNEKTIYLGKLYTKDGLVEIIAKLSNENGILKNKIYDLEQEIDRLKMIFSLPEDYYEYHME